MTWRAALTTDGTRPDYLAKTLRGLARAGWGDVVVYTDTERRGPVQAFLGALASLALARAIGDYFVVFQDDVEVPRGLRSHLTADPPPEGAVVSLFCPAAVADGAPGWQPPPRMPRSYGAQAIAVQAGDVCNELFMRLIESPHNGRQLDYWITKVCRDQGVPFLLHRPSYVQHIGDDSSLDRPNTSRLWRVASELWSADAAHPTHCTAGRHTK